jgi:eukaryotic-like serine/threonine-protein kinase
MSAQVIQRDQLGALTKIGQGGQGVVFAAPKVKTKFAASMVYKEYKAQVLAGIDFTALSAMPALVEDTLTYKEAERLIALAAWPCALVENGGAPSGFVMPVIPAEFFIELTTVKGVSSTTAEFQHLLNHPSVLAARGTSIDDAQRYTLLREAASGLAFLHKHGVCVGDISPKNLLYSLSPHAAVYLIDCDAMRINGVSALTQVETPGWEVPSGEELATIYSDTYKLGLLALRLLAGDHDTTNPQHLPATTPALLRQIITDTVTKPPHQRPLPEAWTYVLGHAIEEAQHRILTAPTTPVAAAGGIAAPVIPTVHSRPSAQPAGYSQPPASAPPPLQPAGYSGPPPSPWASPPNKSSSSTGAIVAVGAAVVVAVIVLSIVLVKNHNGASQASSNATATYPTISSAAQAAPTSDPAYPSATAAPTASTDAAPALVPPPELLQTADLNGDTSCVGGRSIPNHSGGRVGLGSNKTTCPFAWNVGQAYWASNPSPNRVQRVIAQGTVPCPKVQADAPVNVECSGNDFVMQCAMFGSDQWITCTGGNDARVYIF